MIELASFSPPAKSRQTPRTHSHRRGHRGARLSKLFLPTIRIQPNYMNQNSLMSWTLQGKRSFFLGTPPEYFILPQFSPVSFFFCILSIYLFLLSHFFFIFDYFVLSFFFYPSFFSPSQSTKSSAHPHTQSSTHQISETADVRLQHTPPCLFLS